MKKEIYLIRHSAPFVKIDNYINSNPLWDEYNNNMILNEEGEEKAKELIKIDELTHIDEIYSSSSSRAIATIKYLAHKNNINIKLDDRINERKLGYEYLNDIDKNYNLLSFSNKDYKVNNGESLNEVDNRFSNFINDILNNNSKRIVISLHGIIMLSFLQTKCDFKYDGKIFNIKYNNKELLNGIPSNPDIYKLTYIDKKLSNIERIYGDKNE